MNRIKPMLSYLIKTTGQEVDRTAKRRMEQTISQGGRETEIIAPKIIQNIIEQLYKTPFILLGAFGCKRYKHLKLKINRLVKTKCYRICCEMCLTINNLNLFKIVDFGQEPNTTKKKILIGK